MTSLLCNSETIRLDSTPVYDLLRCHSETITVAVLNSRLHIYSVNNNESFTRIVNSETVCPSSPEKSRVYLTMYVLGNRFFVRITIHDLLLIEKLYAQPVQQFMTFQKLYALSEHEFMTQLYVI